MAWLAVLIGALTAAFVAAVYALRHKIRAFASPSGPVRRTAIATPRGRARYSAFERQRKPR